MIYIIYQGKGAIFLRRYYIVKKSTNKVIYDMEFKSSSSLSLAERVMVRGLNSCVYFFVKLFNNFKKV